MGCGGLRFGHAEDPAYRGEAENDHRQGQHEKHDQPPCVPASEGGQKTSFGSSGKTKKRQKMLFQDFLQNVMLKI